MSVFTISDGVKEIASQMKENPHDWVQTNYEYVNRSYPDIRIWTANGANYIKLRGNDAFSLAEKKYLNRAIKKSIANKLNNYD